VTFIMMGVMDYGNALQQSIRLEDAARAGAQVAFTRPGDTVNNTNDPDAALVRAAVLANLQGWSPAGTCTGGTGTGVCVSYVSWCQCPQQSGAVGTAFAFECNADSPPCDDFNRYGSVTVTRNYSPLIIAPMTTLRANVTIRVR
jgi:Flp pilus assembly protein TadG